MKTNIPSPDDLDWLAFRYLAGEMAADETARFEEWLAADQAPREAVARAVEIAQAVVVLESEWTRCQRHGAPSRLRWGVSFVSAAVCLSLVVGLFVLRGDRSASDHGAHAPVAARNHQGDSSVQDAWERGAANPLPAGDLVALWTQSWTAREAAAAGADENPESDWTAWDGLQSAGTDSAETGVVVPDWMLAAVVSDGSAGMPTADGVDSERQMEN